MRLDINDGVCQLTGSVEEMGKLIGEAQQAAYYAPPDRRQWLRGLARAADRLSKEAILASGPVEPVGQQDVPLVLLGPGGDFRRTWPEQTQEVPGDREHAPVPA